MYFCPNKISGHFRIGLICSYHFANRVISQIRLIVCAAQMCYYVSHARRWATQWPDNIGHDGLVCLLQCSDGPNYKKNNMLHWDIMISGIVSAVQMKCMRWLVTPTAVVIIDVTCNA